MKRSGPPERRTPLAAGSKPLKRTAAPKARSQLKASPPSQPKPRKRVNAVSDKRLAERPTRQAVVAAVHARDRTCQGVHMIPGHEKWDCAGPLDVHEVIPRSAWAKGYLEPANCVLLCRKAHDWVGDNPEAAHAVGLHGYSWERPK